MLKQPYLTRSIVLLLLLHGVFFSLSSQNPAIKIPIQPFSFAATSSDHPIFFTPAKGKSIMIIASEWSHLTDIPASDKAYLAHSAFGEGTPIGKGFVVYNGSGNSTTLSHLTKGKKYYLFAYAFDSNGFSEALSLSEFNATTEIINAKSIPSQPQTVVTCVCPAVAGITCTLTGTTNTGSSVASAAGCPHVGYCDGPGTNNSWSSAAGTGTLQYQFSAPVSASTLRANSVNTNDYATISAVGGSGGSLSISGVVCMSFSGLVIGPLTVASSYGGVSWNVNSTGSYTTVLLTNTGAQSGWVSACPTAITPAALPIELVSLKGNCEGSRIKLNWQTSSEKNNSYFSVERSYDTESWEEIGKVAAAGTSYSLRNYSFTDIQPLKTDLYYRLKQTDFDLSYKYSELIAVASCGTENQIMAYPNPARDEINLNCKQKGELDIFNSMGIKTGTFSMKPGRNVLNTSLWENDTYLLNFSGANGEVHHLRIVVIH